MTSFEADKTLKSMDKNLERLVNQIQWNNWLTYISMINDSNKPLDSLNDITKERIESGIGIIGINTIKHKDA